jgi:FMN reductase
MDVAVVVGNPKPRSRTLAAATLVAERLADGPPAVTLDLIELGPGLLGWGDPDVTAAVESVKGCDVAIFASPTYKASFTGVLKLFLDQLGNDGLAGVVAVPLMLGAGPHHALAPEMQLRPVLVELGASCPTRALYLLDSAYEDPVALDAWAAVARPQILAAAGA